MKTKTAATITTYLTTTATYVFAMHDIIDIFLCLYMWKAQVF